MAVNKPGVKAGPSPKAVPANTKAAPAAAAMNVASLNPDNMVQAGLMDDFDGTIMKARFAPWDYNGNIDHHILAVALTIRPDEGQGEEFVQHYSVGELEHFVPSMDGAESVDLEHGEGDSLEGLYALRVGRKEGLSNSSNFAHFMVALTDAGFDKAAMSASIDFLEGTHGHFNRIPQKKRSGIISQGADGQEKKRANDILVITELTDGPGIAAPAKSGKTPGAKIGGPQSASGAAPNTAAAATTGDLDAALVDIIVEAVHAAGDDGLAKNKLASLALSKLPGNLKAKGVKRIVDNDLLTNGAPEGDGVATWAFDADSGTLYPVTA